jgi:hypothetical protein
VGLHARPAGPDRPAFGVGEARPHQLNSPLLRALDLACVKRPRCVIQDEAFGVLHQAITVSLQLVGNPIACAAGQRGAEAGVEGGGAASIDVSGASGEAGKESSS